MSKRRSRKAPRAEGPRSRADLVARVQERLAREAWPRIEMTLMLALAGACGFFASFVMLHAGVTSMTLRYPFAVAFAYAVFLLLLRGWIWMRGPSLPSSHGGNPLSGVDIGDLDIVGDIADGIGRLGGSSDAADVALFGGGGDFGGGGASDSWGGSSGVGSMNLSSGGGGGGGGGFSLDVDLDEIVWVLIAAALVLSALLACLYVVYVAPALLAEVLVDSLLVAGLYKRIAKGGSGGWLRTAIRGTWIPVLVVALLLGAAGLVLEVGFPDARSIGEVWHAIEAPPPPSEQP